MKGKDWKKREKGTILFEAGRLPVMKVKDLINKLAEIKNQNADIFVLDDYGEAHSEPVLTEDDDGSINIGT